MILAAVPVWMAEVVPPYLRGALVQLHAVILVVGYMCASWLGYGIFFWKDGGSATWRIPFAIQCFFPLCLLLGLYWCPESREYPLIDAFWPSGSISNTGIGSSLAYSQWKIR